MRMGSFGVRWHEPHQRTLGRAGFFLLEAGDAEFSIACVDDAGKARLDVANHARLVLLQWGFFLLRSSVTYIARVCRSVILLAATPPPPYNVQ